jgi:hypothetical protein
LHASAQDVFNALLDIRMRWKDHGAKESPDAVKGVREIHRQRFLSYYRTMKDTLTCLGKIGGKEKRVAKRNEARMRNRRSKVRCIRVLGGGRFMHLLLLTLYRAVLCCVIRRSRRCASS